MNPSPRLLFLLIVVIGHPACGKSPPVARSSASVTDTMTGLPPRAASDTEVVRRADSLFKLDPLSEARRAIERGDLRAVGVCGYVCRPPEFTEADTGGLRRYGQVLIAGTSDGVATEGVARLNIVASRYAAAYNRLIFAAWQTRASPKH